MKIKHSALKMATHKRKKLVRWFIVEYLNKIQAIKKGPRCTREPVGSFYQKLGIVFNFIIKCYGAFILRFFYLVLGKPFLRNNHFVLIIAFFI